MSNQNNAMQKMEMQSNVNLSRYKNNIDGALKINDTNMPVLGNKFNPMKKETTIYTRDKLVEVKNSMTHGVFEYNETNYIKDIGWEVVGSDTNVIGIGNDHVIFFYSENLSSITVFNTQTGTTLQSPMAVSSPSEFCIFDCGNDVFYFTEGINIYHADMTTPSGLADFICAGKLLDVVKIPMCSSHRDASTYSIGGAKTDCLLYEKDNQIHLRYNTEDITLTKFFVVATEDNNYKIIFNEILQCIAWNNVTSKFVSIIPDATVPYYHGYHAMVSNLTNLDIVESKIDINGFIYTTVAKIGKSSAFKLVVGNPYYRVENNVNYYATIENNVLTDNFIFCDKYNDMVYYMQGANILTNCGVGMGIIDQKFITKYANSNYLSNIFRDTRKNFHFVVYGLVTHATQFPPALLNDLLYSYDKITDVVRGSQETRNVSTKYIDAFLSYLKSYDTTYGNTIFTSVDDWLSKARYYVIGNGNIMNDNYILPQLAPVLTIDFNGLELKNYPYIYVQKTTDDATLYNHLNEPYVAPTDGDFYIPLMPTDKIASNILGEVIVRRIDGSSAKLTRYNNRVLPCYQYSSIAENIDYTFVCQGQSYNIIGGVIFDENATGIVDVSDMQFIGCNGIFALFWNERSQTIYQFNASNGIDKLIESDDIQGITVADINHVNDEIYIAYVDFNDNRTLICIENDGNIYKICNDDVTDFFIGSNGVYVKVNGKNAWELYITLRYNGTETTQNCYLETNYFGTDEFKLMNVDRVYLRFVPTVENGPVNDITVNLSMLTLDGEVNEQYVVNPSTEIHRIAPRQKQCLGIKVRLDNLVNYTLSAMSIGVTDDCNVVTDNKVINNNLDASLFD